MERLGLIRFNIYDAHSGLSSRRIRPDATFAGVFGSYSTQGGYETWETQFIYRNTAVDWQTTPANVGLAEGGTICVIRFSWLFAVGDLAWIDLWQVEQSEDGQIRNTESLAARRQVNSLDSIHHLRVRTGREYLYANRLPGIHRIPCNEEDIVLHTEVLHKSDRRARRQFFLQRDIDNIRLIRRWLTYGFYRVLVFTAGSNMNQGTIMTRQRYGACWIIMRVMQLVCEELTTAREEGDVDTNLRPYHGEFRGHVNSAVRVMRVCRLRIGSPPGICRAYLAVDQAAAALATVFQPIPPDVNDICPICQEEVRVPGYGVLVCGHMLHRNCRSNYQQSRHGMPGFPRFPCPLCQRAGLLGFRSIHE